MARASFGDIVNSLIKLLRATLETNFECILLYSAYTRQRDRVSDRERRRQGTDARIHMFFVSRSVGFRVKFERVCEANIPRLTPFNN